MQINLTEIANGALQENVQTAIEKVVANMLDPNTPYKNKRQVTVKLSFLQNEARDDVTCDVSVETKLAPVKPLRTSFAIGSDLATGEIYVEEYGKQIKGQMSLKDMQHQQEDEAEQADLEKSEIIDYRKAKKA